MALPTRAQRVKDKAIPAEQHTTQTFPKSSGALSADMMLQSILDVERRRIDALQFELDSTGPITSASEAELSTPSATKYDDDSSDSSGFASLHDVDPDKDLAALHLRLAQARLKHGSNGGTPRKVETPRVERGLPAYPTADVTTSLSSSEKIVLTPEQRHYLVRVLVTIQLAEESEQMFRVGALTRFGPPFTSSRTDMSKLQLDNEYTYGELKGQGFSQDPFSHAAKDLLEHTEHLQDPILLQQMLHTSFLTIPFLKDAPDHFFHSRLQPLIDEVAVRTLSTSLERAQVPAIRYLILLLVNLVAHYFARGVGVRGTNELPGPGSGVSDGKVWGAGTVKRGLARPTRINRQLHEAINNLFRPGSPLNRSDSHEIQSQIYRSWTRAGTHAGQVQTEFNAFWTEVIENPKGLRETWRCTRIPSIFRLPLRFQLVAEYLRDTVAGWIRKILTMGPHADSIFRLIKGIHSLFPWWAARQTLRVANAKVVVQGLTTILLARPGGTKSLIQRIADYVCHREIKILDKESIEPIVAAIRHGSLVHKVLTFVKHAGRMERVGITNNTRREGDDVLTTLLLSTKHGPTLSQDDTDQILEMQRSFGLSKYRGHLDAAYPPESSKYSENARKEANQAFRTTYREQANGTLPTLNAIQAQDAHQFALLKLLLREALAKRDLEMIVETVDGALVPTVIKEFLQYVVYPIIELASNNTDLASHLGDLQKALDDMIKVRQGEDNSIHAWIALASRHYDKLWYFAHKMTLIPGISDPLLYYCQVQCNFMATSSSDPFNPSNKDARNFEVNCEQLLSQSVQTSEELDSILAELNDMQSWVLWEKVREELHSRKRLLLAHEDSHPPSGLGRSSIPSPEFGSNVEDSDLLMERLMYMVAKTKVATGSGALSAHKLCIPPPTTTIDDGHCRSEARGTEAKADPGTFFDMVDPCGQHLMAESDVSNLAYVPTRVAASPPRFYHVRSLLPAFRTVMRRAVPIYHD